MILNKRQSLLGIGKKGGVSMFLGNNFRGTNLTIPVHRAIVSRQEDQKESIGKRVLQILLPCIIVAAGLTVIVWRTPGEPDIEPYRQQIEKQFSAEGAVLSVRSEPGQRVDISSDPYGGKLGADGYDEWSFAGSAQPVWCGYYEDSEDLDWIVGAISEDGSSLMIKSGDSTSVSSIGRDSDRRIYRTENILVYYDGGNPEVYALLEKLCGKPIADGSKSAE